VLLATDDEYLLEIAEEPVEIDRFKTGEMNEAADLARSSGACPVPDTVLGGATADHLEQGRRLLEEALKMKPRFAEARLYLGFVRQLKNEPEAAAEAYREVFLRTDRTVNRAHAAIQLGLLYDRQEESRKALRIFRWVLACGLLSRKPEFAFVLHNIAVAHIALGKLDEAVQMFLRMKTEFPETWEHSKTWLLGAPETLARLHNDPAARRFLKESEPALLAACQG
ncbi:MAG: tetratricopeptide repeat protein, partial [Planctomycetota bacterium]